MLLDAFLQKNGGMRRLFFFLMLWIPAFCGAESLPSNIHVVTPVWEGQTQRDGTGFFFEIIKKIYEPRGISLSWEFANWERSMDLVKKGYADAMPSVWREDASGAGLKTPRLPLYMEYTAAVFKKRNFPDWRGIPSLAGRSVIWFKGYNYHLRPPLSTISMKWMEISSEGHPWKMLTADRADVLMDARIDVDAYIEEHLVDMTVFQVASLWGQKAYLAFSDQPSSEKLMEVYDAGMADLLASGELQRIHEKWAVSGFDPKAWTQVSEVFIPEP